MLGLGARDGLSLCSHVPDLRSRTPAGCVGETLAVTGCRPAEIGLLTCATQGSSGKRADLGSAGRPRLQPDGRHPGQKQPALLAILLIHAQTGGLAKKGSGRADRPSTSDNGKPVASCRHRIRSTHERCFVDGRAAQIPYARARAIRLSSPMCHSHDARVPKCNSNSASSASSQSSLTVNASTSGDPVSGACSRCCFCSAIGRSRPRCWPTNCGLTTTDQEPPTVQIYVSRLRDVLGAEAGRLSSTASGYRLAVADHEFDVARFGAAYSQARETSASGDQDRARAILEAALAEWSGPALGDMADERFARSGLIGSKSSGCRPSRSCTRRASTLASAARRSPNSEASWPTSPGGRRCGGC